MRRPPRRPILPRRLPPNLHGERMSHPSHFPSHYVPRSAAGRRVVGLFLLLLLLAEPPVVHLLANRVEPWILGVPFLYAYLLLLYVGMIGVLLWAMKRRL